MAAELGPPSKAELRVAVIFVSVVLLWMTRRFIADSLAYWCCLVVDCRSQPRCPSLALRSGWAMGSHRLLPVDCSSRHLQRRDSWCFSLS